MKPDEFELAQWALRNDGRIVDKPGTHGSKRVRYILQKWAGRGWWEYGVSPWCGWLTESGRAVLGARVPSLGGHISGVRAAHVVDDDSHVADPHVTEVLAALRALGTDWRATFVPQRRPFQARDRASCEVHPRCPSCDTDRGIEINPRGSWPQKANCRCGWSGTEADLVCSEPEGRP